MGQTWIKLSVLYLVVGISVGLFMSWSLQLNWAAGHAHVNVVGWLTTLGIGAVLSIYPHLAKNSLGMITFWLYHIGVPVFLLSTFLVQVNPGVGHIFTFIGGPMFLLAIILFGVNLMMNLKSSDEPHPPSQLLKGDNNESSSDSKTSERDLSGAKSYTIKDNTVDLGPR